MIIFREILMTASEAIKTPQMNVLIKSGEEENAKMIARSFTRLTLLEVLRNYVTKNSFLRFCSCFLLIYVENSHILFYFLPLRTYYIMTHVHSKSYNVIFILVGSSTPLNYCPLGTYMRILCLYVLRKEFIHLILRFCSKSQ